MIDREKLFRLLLNAFSLAFSLDSIIGLDWNSCALFFPNVKFQEAIDYLLENGVTVKEPQKPLTVEVMKELWKKHNSKIVWLEDYTGMTLDVRIWTINTQEVWFEKDVNEIYAPLSTHGRKWRCWIEKPTEEERKAAEWES